MNDETLRVQKEELLSFIERYETLEENKKIIMEDQKAVMKEAKYKGYDPKILKKIIKIRAMDPNNFYEEQAIMDVYLKTLGMNDD